MAVSNFVSITTGSIKRRSRTGIRFLSLRSCLIVWGATIYNSIDLRSGYWQVPLRKEDITKTAFKTHWGLYEFLVIPFGASNALAQFMNLMNDVLADYLDDFVVVFLDDILIYSKTIEDHVVHLWKVLQKL